MTCGTGRGLARRKVGSFPPGEDHRARPVISFIIVYFSLDELQVACEWTTYMAESHFGPP